jgi:hypothetical protein
MHKTFFFTSDGFYRYDGIRNLIVWQNKGVLIGTQQI